MNDFEFFCPVLNIIIRNHSYHCVTETANVSKILEIKTQKIKKTGNAFLHEN